MSTALDLGRLNNQLTNKEIEMNIEALTEEEKLELLATELRKILATFGIDIRYSKTYENIMIYNAEAEVVF